MYSLKFEHEVNIKQCKKQNWFVFAGGGKVRPTPPSSKKGLAQSGYAELCAITCQICKHYPRNLGGITRSGRTVRQPACFLVPSTCLLVWTFSSWTLVPCTLSCSLRDIYQRLFLARLFPYHYFPNSWTLPRFYHRTGLSCLSIFSSFLP